MRTDELKIANKFLVFLIIMLIILNPYLAFASEAIKAGEKAPFDGRIFTVEETNQLLLKLDLLERTLEENALLKQKIEALEEKNKALEQQKEVLLKSIELYKQQFLTMEQLQQRYEALWDEADKLLMQKEKRTMSTELRAGLYAAIFILGCFLGVQATK